MKLNVLAAASGLALAAFLSAANAQGSYPTPSGDRVDANGMPTTHSTPAEAAQTSDLNNQVGSSNAAADSQASAANAQYQQQQQQYQQQLQQNQAQQQQYQDRTAQYDALRARYAAERAAYHRGMWPERYSHWMVMRDASLNGERVELLDGNRVGTVIDTAHAANGNVEALLVRLGNDKIVWIDQQDVRFNRADGIVMTDLEATDLRHMADERV